MSLSNENKANKDYNSAISTLNRKFGLGNKYKQAIPKLESSANAYRELNLHFHAANAFKALAESYLNLKEYQSEAKAAKAYEEAAESYLNFQDQSGTLEKLLGDINEISKTLSNAAECYRKASSIFAEKGDILKAAKLESQAGDAFEETMLAMIKTRSRLEEQLKFQNDKENGVIETEESNENKEEEEDELMKKVRKDISERKFTKEDIDSISEQIKDACTRATEHYQLAADYHESDSNYPNANSALKRKVQIAMDGGEYRIAYRTLENLFDAEWNQEKSGSRSKIYFDSNTFLYKMVLCKLLAMDITEVEMTLEIIRSVIDNYEGRTNNFEASREGELITSICRSFEKKDIKIFLRAVTTFEKVGKLDDENTSFLLKIRRKLEEFIGRIEEVSLI